MNEAGEVEYRPIPGLEGYRAGSDGTIWSAWTKVGGSIDGGRGIHFVVGNTWRKMTPVSMKGRKYQYVCVRIKYRVFKTILIHKLILLTFVGPRPAGLQTRHKNGNPRDNRLSNLLYGTSKENADDRVKHGTSPVGEKNPRARLSVKDVLDIRSLVDRGVPREEVARRFDITKTHVSYIATRKSWSHIP
jgi:hypothetical protein